MSHDQTYHVTHLAENKQKLKVSPKTFIEYNLGYLLYTHSSH